MTAKTLVKIGDMELDTPLVEAARRLPRSATWLREMVARGRLQGARVGHVWWVNFEEVRRHVEWKDSMTPAERCAIRYNDKE